MPTQEPKVRRRFTFSLRILMLAILLVGGFLGYWIRSARLQRQAVATLAGVQATALYDFEVTDDKGKGYSKEATVRILLASMKHDGLPIPIGMRDLSDKTPLPKGNWVLGWVRGNLGIDFVQDVVYATAYHTRLNADQLDAIAGLSRLTYLCMSNTGIGDTGLARVRGLRRLKALDLWHDGITDDGLVHLAGFDRLENLGLVGNPKITDAGLVHLRALKRLRLLEIGQTNVTDAGLAELKEALPGLVILR